MAWCDHSDYYMLQKLPKLGEKKCISCHSSGELFRFIEVSIQPKIMINVILVGSLLTVGKDSH